MKGEYEMKNFPSGISLRTRRTLSLTSLLLAMNWTQTFAMGRVCDNKIAYYSLNDVGPVHGNDGSDRFRVQERCIGGEGVELSDSSWLTGEHVSLSKGENICVTRSSSLS
ncbi:hypothetical protein F5B20DRAFT_551605 [Whalleya microplaca]|nr:hypothetical protein F5B20DRAFT_551605 [Whalleya microplaca]